MSFADQLGPDGKEIQIGEKKYDQDSKITFNMKAFMSLVIIIGTMFAATYYFIDKRIDQSDDEHSEKLESLESLVDQLKDERITDLKEQVDATNGKMELLMMLINSNQINVTETRQPNVVNEVRSVDPNTNNLPNLDNISTQGD